MSLSDTKISLVFDGLRLTEGTFYIKWVVTLILSKGRRKLL